MKKTPLKIQPAENSLSKNYYRDLLLQLIEKTDHKPMLFSGRYKHNSDVSYFTFTTIRPVLTEGVSITICNHVNFSEKEIGHFYQFSKEVHNRKFYFVGYPDTYCHYGECRGKIQLEHNLGIPAVFITDDLKKYITTDIKQKLFYINEALFV